MIMKINRNIKNIYKYYFFLNQKLKEEKIRNKKLYFDSMNMNQYQQLSNRLYKK